MVSIGKRMRKLKSLLSIRVGLGAAVLPPPSSAPQFAPVTRLHLTYARKIYEGHQGARKFWRECLPRLKFYNPGVPVTVRQTDEQKGPAFLTVYFDRTAGGNLSSLQAKATDTHAPGPAESEKVSTLDVKNAEVKDIWARFKALTGAEEVKTSESDQALAEEHKRLDEQSVVDRQRHDQLKKVKQDQERQLQEARAAVEKLKHEQ